ncbi:MAG: helix-turn-helix domain-containing protein [Rhodobacteraceae bacterium]|nr:helix-turn-helix domain-containing protein [Paracoccaceae bacterium]
MAKDYQVTGKSNDTVIKSVARTFELLELFDEMRRPMNVVEVAKRLGYPQSSASALLKSMVTLGFVAYDSNGRTYFPTERVPLIGSWMDPIMFGEGALQKLLKAVSLRSRQLVLFGARNGDEAQYTQVINPKKKWLDHISLGTRRPLGTSGLGHVLLSTMPDDEIRRLFHRINAFRGAEVPAVNIREFLDSVRTIREKGYFCSVDRVVKGSGLIAMLLPQKYTSRPLAIGIGAPTNLIMKREKELAQILCEEVSLHFGTRASCVDPRKGSAAMTLRFSEPRQLSHTR